MTEDWNWELGAVKLLMVVIIFIVGIVFGLLPLLTGKIKAATRNKVLGICNSFAAGIFLAAGLVHLFSESIELFSHLYDLHFFNPAFLLAPLGFFFTFMIDKVIFTSNVTVDGEETNFKPHSVDVTKEHDENEHIHVKHTFSGHGHSHGLNISEDGKPSIANYILVAVLSFHSILAGFVIGLEDEVSSVVLVFLALVSHHWVESFALGCNLLRATVHVRPMSQLILFFSFMAPIGIIIGTLLNSLMSNEAGEVLEAYTIAIAAGSFLYVAIVDILVEEFLIIQNKWAKTVALVIGFLVETTVVLLFESLAHAEEDH